MAIVEVKVPQLSESVAEATIGQWKKKPGEAVVADEILVEVETDKVVLEVPAPSVVIATIVKDDGARSLRRGYRHDRYGRQGRSRCRCGAGCRRTAAPAPAAPAGRRRLRCPPRQS
jgi:2-oxoglutarate dehydrogenase E2 component (dihydrolipoamide succinyltransferase)